MPEKDSSKSWLGPGPVWGVDLPASLVVFLVALPLCMGVAIASGVPIAAGLITGIVGGLITGVLAGCPLQVSGPAAGLLVIVYELVTEYGLAMLGPAVAVGGVIQLVAAACGLGPWFRAVAPAVIRGMLTGIGVLIFASQFHVMVDDDPKGSPVENLAAIPSAIQKSLVVPEFSEPDVRAFRTAALREIGELEALQADLIEELHGDLDEVAADASPGERVDPTDEQRAETRDALNEWVEHELDLRERIEAVLARWHDTAAMEGFANAGIATDDLTAARDLVDEAIGHARAGEAAETEESALKASDTLFEVEKDLRNHQFAAVLGIGTIAVIVLWAVLKPKPLAFLPGPLIAIVATTLLAFFLTLPVAYVNVPDSLLGSLHPVNDPAWWSLPWGAVLVAGGTFALVASAETLLCAVAVDSTGKGPRTNYDRELLAQGVGNTIAGLLGALPMTGVIVRSTANIDAGAKTRWSAVLHGFWLLLFVGFLTSLLKLVPTSALAGILVYTGYKLVAPQALWKLWNVDPWEAMICVIVVAVIVIEDLLVGVGVGVVLSAIKLLATFARLDIDVVCDGDCDRKQIVTLRGAATFVRLPKLAAVLEDMPGNAELHVDLHDLVYIDHACLELLTNWADRHKKQGGSLVLDWESMHAKFKEDAPLTRAVTPREAVATVTTGESAVAVAER